MRFRARLLVEPGVATDADVQLRVGLVGIVGTGQSLSVGALGTPVIASSSRTAT